MKETPDVHGAYPRLSADQVEALDAVGSRRLTRKGEFLFREGDSTCDFYVIVSGFVAMVEGDGESAEELAVHGPGRFLGELALLTGEVLFVSAVVREPGEVLLLPVDRLRALVTQEPALGDLILRAYIARRSLLIDSGTGLRIVGSRFSADTRRLREFAARNRIPHRFIDLELDAAVEQLLLRLDVRPDETPVVIWGGKQILRNPSNRELATRLGLQRRIATEVFDLIVVGAGPAGLAAAVYGASEGFRTLVLEAVGPGGQAGTSPRIENYLGFPSGVSGSELAERAVVQAEKFGARISVPAGVCEVAIEEGLFTLRLDDGTEAEGRSVVVATGAHYRRLDVPRVNQFEGAGVYYAATQVEATLCSGDPVAVVGGGNSAGQAALFLTKQAVRVTLLIRGPDLGANMSRYLVDQLQNRSSVDVHLCTEVRQLVGDRALGAVEVEHTATGERETIPARALFVFIGAEPQVRWLADQVALDDHGFVLTGLPALKACPGLDHQPLFLETTRPGLFAAGDVRSGSVKRAAAAVGEGAMAVRLLHDRLQSH